MTRAHIFARSGLVLALLTGLVGCGTTSGSQGLVFPRPQAGMGYSTMGGMGPVVGQDPSEMAAINPFDPIALNNLAVVEASRAHYQQALSLLQRAVKLAPARADIAANLGSLQRWLAQAEGQAAIGLAPQPLQLPYQETGVPEIPALWAPAPTVSAASAPAVVPGSSAAGRLLFPVAPPTVPDVRSGPLLVTPQSPVR
jgi:hypothetical protein